MRVMYYNDPLLLYFVTVRIAQNDEVLWLFSVLVMVIKVAFQKVPQKKYFYTIAI